MGGHIVLAYPSRSGEATTRRRDPRDLEDKQTHKWLIDPGCGYGLVAPEKVNHLRDSIFPAAHQPTLWAASGVTRDGRRALVGGAVAQLNESCPPHVMKISPDILPMGRRRVEDGHALHGPAGFSAPDVHVSSPGGGGKWGHRHTFDCSPRSVP